MNDRTLKRLEALYYECAEEIPESDDRKTAYAALKAAVKRGKNVLDEDAFFKFEAASLKQGFAYGFRAAARMGDLLKEAAQ